ncbi:hypothetical protein F511_27087 [Dorcoceras hygrometricum]|uniref:RRM domain-containing protein n=1 Tax=Dorcoceras hygrometricum TaxID=472368 RepID=A0A2Z7ACA4_9LAMI|nr:hypothetical protein F511_27087 [Dorcoceras hygrometricum]
MDPFIPPVTLEESKIFQKIDRQLYTILAMNLRRNPFDCLQIMGLWLWFERNGYSNAISKILSQPMLVINELADEAIACLKCMDCAQFPLQFEAIGIPLTQIIMQRNVSLKFFHLLRFTAPSEIQTLITEVYVPVLSDIMEKALYGGFGENLNDIQMGMQGHAVTSSNSTMVHSSNDVQLMQSFSNVNNHGDSPPPQSNGGQANEQALYERTMFATFSKGYPVSESEIRQFFTKVYGNCVESVHMQEVRVDQQALYARVVFVTPAFIESVLSGMSKAKFSINGKHVWMRKFVPNNGRP